MGFLGDVVATREPDEEMHVILDNLSAHKTNLVEAFLDAYLNVTRHLHADLCASRPSAQGAAIALRPLLDGGLPGIDVFTPDAHPADGCVSLPRGVTDAVEAVNAGALWARDGSTQGDSYPQEFHETQYFSSCTTFFIDR